MNTPNSNKPLRCAVIGVGYLGKFHAEKYAMANKAELVAVCDYNKEAAQKIADKHNTEACTDYNELIGKVDAVSIVTPTVTHFEIAKFFLENGIHVLLEKPLTSTLKDAEELVSIIEKNPQLVLQIGHLERINSAFTALREKISTPMFIEARRITPFKNRALDVSVVVDLMIHDIDLIAQLAKSDIKEINAFGSKLVSDNIDLARAEIIFANGCKAHLAASRVSSADVAERSLYVVEEKGCHYADLANKRLLSETFGESEEMPKQITSENFDLPKNDAIFDEINSFLDSIEEQKTPMVTAKEATNALAIALKIDKIIQKND